MSPGDSSPETPLIGTNYERLTKLPVRSAGLIASAGALIVTVVGLVYLLTSAGLHRADTLTGGPDRLFGDPCNASANATEGGRCNADLYLSCNKNNSRCECMAGMFVDVNTVAKLCVTKVGERCTNNVEKGFPIKRCVRWAACLPDPFGALTCYCKDNYVQNSHGACMPTYDGQCSRNVDCSPKSFLKCGPGHTCTCDFENDSQVWNETIQQCASLIGAGCTPEGAVVRPCVDPTKSICQKDNGGDICKCKAGFIPSFRNHGCGIPFNGTCVTTADCAGHFVCDSEKKCGCPNQQDQFYDLVHGQCISYAGTRCIYEGGHLMECVVDATCEVLFGIDGIMCICNQNFHEENRFCVLNIGTRLQSLGVPLILVAVLIAAQLFII